MFTHRIGGVPPPAKPSIQEGFVFGTGNPSPTRMEYRIPKRSTDCHAPSWLAMTGNYDRRRSQPTGDCHGGQSPPRNDKWGRLEQPSSTEIAGLPFRSVHRGRAIAKIDRLLWRGNVCCTHNSARLEGSGEVALIAGAINSNPPQPASLVSFLPEQERYPPEELHLLIPQRVSFSTQTAPQQPLSLRVSAHYPVALRNPSPPRNARGRLCFYVKNESCPAYCKSRRFVVK